MRTITKCGGFAVLMMIMAAMLQPATAICSSARLVTSGYSYVITPGCEAGGCGPNSSSLTGDATGVFWAIGDGSPASGVGIDNGSFPCLGGWCYIYPGYAALLTTAWSADAGIDGCIDFASDTQRCMAVLFMDNDAGSGAGAFALLTDEPDLLGNYDFGQAGNINLAAIPAPVVSSVAPSPTGVDVTVSGVSFLDGLYLDPACAPLNGLITEYLVYAQVVPDGALAPTGRDVGLWTLIGSGSLGSPTSGTVACSEGEDVYLAYGAGFESNFVAAYLSLNSALVDCQSDGDGDFDGIPDLTDNCPVTPNPGQEDDDSDGVGNLCDNCPNLFNPGQLGSDVGDRVWLDADGDGIQDAGEVGISGVPVVLYDASLNIVGFASTDAGGAYQIGAVCSGDYVLQVHLPLGHSFSPADQGANDTLDSDVDRGSGTVVVTLGEGLSTDLDAGLVVGCAGPDEPVYISNVSLTDDGNAYPILTIQDPNQPSAVTGFNVYRSDDPAVPAGSWTLVASNVVDMDEATPNKQWVDTSGDLSPTGVWHYQVTAYSSTCSAEGPR